MALIKDFKGCRVIIYDAQRKVHIVETNIEEYDKNTHSIFVNVQPFTKFDTATLVLLILFDGHVYEYGGNLRKNNDAPFREISLYKEKIIEGRQAIRYAVNAPATIESVFIANKEIKKNPPLNVIVVNISTVGVMVQTAITALNVNTVFRLNIKVNNSLLDVKCKVKHIKIFNDKMSQYGCEFLDKIVGEE